MKADHKSKYDETMEHIKLTPEARERILRAVENADLNGPRSRLSKIISFPVAARVAAAACLLIVIGAAAAAVIMSRPAVPEVPEDLLTGGYSPVDYRTCGELSEAVGFPVEDAASIFPGAENVPYTDLFGETAEISFSVDGREYYFRKSPGSADNSGDYNEYEEEKHIECEGVEITLKGGSDGCSLALWSDGGYSYSLGCDPPTEYDMMAGVVGRMIALPIY